MDAKNRRIAVISAVGMLILILDSKTALSGAAEGINLCVYTLVPSLFPFFVLSILLTGSLTGETLKLLQPIGIFCKMPKGTESLIAVSMLGGYPVGAQNVSLLYRQGQLSPTQATRLLAFCNNAGPAFIFGVLGNMFSNASAPWLLWLVHILSAFLVGLLIPDTGGNNYVQSHKQEIRITDAIAQAIKTQVLVCGWVVSMRIILSFMDAWFFHFLPDAAQVLISGILELSNGCIRLSEIEYEGVRFLIASCLLSLGGFCVALQTASITDGISMKLYYPGKILQCSISIFLSSFFQFVFPVTERCRWLTPMTISVVMIILITLFLRISKKVVEFQNPLVYNHAIINKEVSSCCFAKK